MPAFSSGGLAAAGPFSAVDRIVQAEAAVRDFCRWHIAPTREDQVDIDGSEYVTQVLPTRNLVAVSNVQLDGRPLVEGVNFKLDRVGILRRIDCGRWCGRLTLTMSHGYPMPPEAVQAVIGDLVKGADSAGAASMQAGPFSITPNAAVGGGGVVGLSDQQKATLSRYALEPGLC